MGPPGGGAGEGRAVGTPPEAGLSANLGHILVQIFSPKKLTLKLTPTELIPQIPSLDDGGPVEWVGAPVPPVLKKKNSS